MSTPAPVPAPAPEPSPWNLPNALTVLRILLVPVFVWLLLRDGGDDAASRWWAFGVFAVAIVTDRVDGDIARARGIVTNFGKVADPIADKALTGAGFITLSIIDVIPWWVSVVVVARELGITLMRFFVIRHGVMPASRGGKVKTFLQAQALLILMAPLWVLPWSRVWEVVGYVILAAAVAVTIATAVDYVMKALTLRETSERAAMKRARAGRDRQVP
ncbi:CDP-diacylglycerol--glycerol-3-phosphate 3-phosphatidyltransferase [Janibacter melonis]|uniref:CDP-diacylglycerol--glycerol-3-phosphate 3-phosphatidyltransferase n=1 Tax=Janibacter TaxID=53457 RepID=UPI001918CDF6|nr:CDP-diacylglycerol--glycerol-3-phosphate 3-phosphatidyltransferase [Janibacter melonis]MCM3555271.1 CDP-diacylglycerol--glycerol-3-phosphate 3-phosphatidyltransferase [Janibacter melonis]